MVHDFSDLPFLPDSVRLRLRRVARVTVGDLDALATVEARRRVEGQWTEWSPIAGLLNGDGAIWCGGGCVVQIRAQWHSALVIEDDLSPADLPRKEAVANALRWLGADNSGTRRQLNARLEDSP